MINTRTYLKQRLIEAANVRDSIGTYFWKNLNQTGSPPQGIGGQVRLTDSGLSRLGNGPGSVADSAFLKRDLLIAG
jgi:hypothetical protein